MKNFFQNVCLVLAVLIMNSIIILAIAFILNMPIIERLDEIINTMLEVEV